MAGARDRPYDAVTNEPGWKAARTGEVGPPS
jgi:hypothetical protein